MSFDQAKKIRPTLGSVLCGMIAGGVVVILLLFFGILHWPSGEVQQDSPESLSSSVKSNLIQTASSVEDQITSSRQSAIVQAAQKVGPAVVSISVVQVRVVREHPFLSPFGDDFWDSFFRPREYKQKVYSIGSGFIINPAGYILTNAHVVLGADQLMVTLTSGEEYEGKLLGLDEASDLAVVKIDTDNLPSAMLGNSDDLIIGEWAIAIGNPFGYLLDDPNPTVTVGVISAVNRDIKREKGQIQIYRKMIQTDAAINPGNSGGPLVNAHGEVIGINTFIFTTSRGSEGIGFAIPITRAKTLLSDLIEFGKVIPAWIGLRVQEVNPILAQSLELEKAEGVIVSDVEKDSPAEKAGLKTKDVVTQVDDQKIRSLSDWEDVVYLVREKQNLEITFLRNGKKIITKLSPESLPAHSTATSTADLGMTIAGISPSIAYQLGTNDKRGVVIAGVDKGGVAYQAGLEVGDIIRQIDDERINNVGDYEKQINRAKDKKRLVLLVERQGTLYFVSVQPRE
jgi:serine protease Do